MYNFEFTLTEEQADTLLALINQAIFTARLNSVMLPYSDSTMEPEAEKLWWQGHWNYLQNMRDAIKFKKLE